jgi:hypothetical protein
MERSEDMVRLKEELRREILDEISRVDASRFGLLEAPDPVPVIPAEGVRFAALHHEESEHHEEGEEHEHMHHFTMFRRDAEGNVVAVDPNDIPRDTSGYGPTGDDEQGHNDQSGRSGNDKDHEQGHAPPKPQRGRRPPGP